MTDLTVTYAHPERLIAQRTPHYQEQWRAIFRTKAGQDYVRENIPSRITQREAAVQWAQDFFRNNSSVRDREAVSEIRMECW